jgi:hypothetical protein
MYGTAEQTGVVEVVCHGTPGEMGRAQGAALRGKIAGARQALSDLESFRLRQPRWLPYRAYRWLAERRAERFLAGALCREEPALGERLRGLAEGAGVSGKVIALFNALEPLLSSLGGCTACPGACSAVAVRGPRSATGEPVIARNFDYLPLVQPFYTVRDSRPPGGLRALEFTVAPLAGTVDGMNEAGLCIAYNYAFTTDATPDPRPPISMLIGQALEHCATVGEAAAWITSRRRCGGGLLMLADAGGDLASLELSATRSHLRRPEPGQDTLFHTNDFRDAAMRAVQVPDAAVYTAAAPRPLRGRRVHRSSERRNQRFRELLGRGTALGEDDLAALMADHGPAGVPDEATPCVHSDYWTTTACMQLFPASRRMRLAYSTACQARYHDIAL